MIYCPVPSNPLTRVRCWEAECAFWDKERRCCSELSNAQAQWEILKKLEEIKGAILTPHPR